MGWKDVGLWGDFVADFGSGRLPEYRFVEPPYNDQADRTVAADQHPDHSVLAGDRFIWDVYRAIRSNDDVWRSTVLLIAWAEHAGLFDHVPPPPLPYARGTPETPFGIIAPPLDFPRLGPPPRAVPGSPSR